MEPANAVRIVLPFFVLRLLNESARDVKKFMKLLPKLRKTLFSSVAGTKGSESAIILPSWSLTILEAYLSASSGLWVTMTTSLSFATSFKSSIICMLVTLSSAPVGSSARSMSGSFTRARAMATLCICPPESWFGFLWACSSSPTFLRASMAFCFLAFPFTPPMVMESSTFASTL